MITLDNRNDLLFVGYGYLDPVQTIVCRHMHAYTRKMPPSSTIAADKERNKAAVIATTDEIDLVTSCNLIH